MLFRSDADTQYRRGVALAMRSKMRKEAVDQDGDGDNDFADVMIARMTASGKKTKKQAIAATKNKSYNKESKVYDPMEDPDFDPREAENKRGVSGKNNPKGGKPVKMKETFSNWREELKEIVDVVTKEQNPEQIKEKKVNNKIKINPTLSLNTGMVGSFKESVETLGGTLLEMVEIDEFDSILDDLSESEIFLLSDDLIEEVVEEFFYECLEEG